MMKSKIRLVLITLLAVTGLSFWPESIPAQRDLVRRATRVATVSFWFSGPPGFAQQQFYLWRTGTSVIHLNARGKLVELNTHTGAEQPVSIAGSIPAGMPISASPDGKVLLWLGDEGGESHGRVLNNTGAIRVAEYNCLFPHQIGWMPDGSAWAEGGWGLNKSVIPGTKQLGCRIRLFNTQHTGMPTDIPIPVATVHQRAQATVANGEILGITPSGTFICTDPSESYEDPEAKAHGYPYSGFVALELNRINEQIVIKRIPVRVPQFADKSDSIPVWNPMLSPDGKKLLYVRITEVRVSAGRSQLAKWGLVKSDSALQTIENVWIGGLDTKLPRKIGEFKTDMINHFFFGVHWMPDSKHISFVSQYVLYTLPVE